MKTKIEIYESNTNETGKFKVWAKIGKSLQCVYAPQQDVQSLLNRSQEEDFFLQDKSKYTFLVPVNDVTEFFKKHSI